MYRRLGETLIADFITRLPTGAVSDADSTPAVAVYEDTTDTAILNPTPVKRTGLTGNYRVSIDMTTANGFEVGRNYNVIATVIAGGITDKARIAMFYLFDLKRAVAAVVTDAGNSSTQFKTDLTEATNDYWKDCLCRFVTGNLANQVKKVTGYNGTTKILSFTSGYTGTPSVADIFVLLSD
jgi:hypothetical protein